MVRISGIALILFGVVAIVAAGSSQAGMVGHFSTVPAGPALNRGPIGELGGKIESPGDSKNVEGSSEYQSREPVETGNLPESAEKLDRQDIDSGP